MSRLVDHPPGDFAATNTAAIAALDATRVTFTAGRLIERGSRARASVTEHFALRGIGTWSPQTRITLSDRNGRWLVAWTPATINPSLGPGDQLLLTRTWAPRAPILGNGGAPLTVERQVVTVGVAGIRIRNRRAVAADLLAAGASRSEVDTALAQARANPGYFEPVFQVSKARFEQLQAQPGPMNVYKVPGTQFELTSVRTPLTPQLAAHLVGTVGPITAQELHELGPAYDAESQVGQIGLEQEYERRLAGSPGATITVDFAGGAPLKTLARFAPKPGRPVLTSIDPAVQRAAEAALAGEPHAAALVAIRASTGQVLAAVSDPLSDAYNTALQGQYPPGSTFKVITTTALIRDGLSPASPASCPATVTVDGEVFHNAEGEAPVQNMEQAFTESCNTAFIGLATGHLKAADFTSAAGLYDLNDSARMGVPSFMAEVPLPSGQTALAATSIGQAQVVFSPLGMAEVAAAVDSGAVRLPRLVAGAPDDSAPTHPLPPAVRTDLQQMMAQVVTSGTAAGTGLPAGTHAKTGTAQYSVGNSLRIDAWLMGYDGDIAFAVIVQNTGGGNGGPTDGPIIAKFLDALGPNA